MRFTFLQTPGRSFIDRLREIKLDPYARKALATLSMAVGVAVLACGTEQMRVVQARTVEHEKFQRLAEDERKISVLRNAVKTVTELSHIAHGINAIRESGNHKASEVMEIADALPPHVWLTSLHQNNAEFILQGGARSYASVGNAMQNLADAHLVHTPTLISSGIRDNLHADTLHYEIHLQEHQP
jgi:Tfp pilus assembly protein PilN